MIIADDTVREGCGAREEVEAATVARIASYNVSSGVVGNCQVRQGCRIRNVDAAAVTAIATSQAGINPGSTIARTVAVDSDVCQCCWST